MMRNAAFSLPAALLVACLSGSSAAAADVPTTQSAATQADEDSPLAQYYGFGDMEILKLRWGVSRPIVADVNRDGLNDMVIVDNAKSHIDVMLQKNGFDPSKVQLTPTGEDINDMFGKEQAWRFKRSSVPLDVAAASMVVTDLNNDGWCDLAFHTKGEGVYVILQNPPKAKPAAAASPAEPAWLPARKVDIRDGAEGENVLAAGDLNGDGRADAALLAPDGVLVVLQNADGSMARPQKYPASQGNSSAVGLLNIADVDGDGRGDLVMLSPTGNEPFRVRFQTPDGQLGPEVRFELPAPRAFELSSLGRKDKLYAVTISDKSGRVRISTLAPNPRQATYPVYLYPLPATDDAEKRDCVAADVNGDGLLDVVVSDPSRAEFLLFQAQPRTQLGTSHSFPGLQEMSKLSAGRLAGDRADAIVAMSEKEKIIGVSRLEKGRLTFPQSVKITGEPVAMDLADINGDGKLDLAYVARDPEKKGDFYLRTVLSLGAKDAADGPELKLTELKDKPNDLCIGDINHDGKPDAMVLRPYEPLLLCTQGEGGKFEQMTRKDVQSGLVANVYPKAFSLTPLGADGKPAVLLAQKTFARALVFDREKGWKVLDQYESADPRSSLVAATAARLTPGKGLAIVAYDAARGQLCVLTEQADGTYRTTTEVEVGSMSARKVLSGNFGGGAAASLLLAAADRLVLVPAVARTEILRQVADYEPQKPGVRLGEVTIGDINSDGVPDVLLADQATHTLVVLTFDGQGKLVPATRFKVFEQPQEVERGPMEMRREGGEPHAITVGDVTGDGKPDVILSVHDRLIIYPQN
ncbi:MAG: hypothetical protein BIFFINMI_02834 [Phycisphaerae bacterium]|nr:hypothetical protein [Phycisphaerae bacterium]